MTTRAQLAEMLTAAFEAGRARAMWEETAGYKSRSYELDVDEYVAVTLEELRKARNR